MSWTEATLGEVTNIVSGTTPASATAAFWGGEHVWVTPTDLGKSQAWRIFDSARRVTDAGVRSCSLPLIPANAIVMSSRAPIGHLAIAGCDLRTNQGCKSFVCSEQLDPEFLFFLLRHRMPEIQALGSGATFVEVSKGALEALEISFPKVDEQRRITTRLKAQFGSLETARQATQAQATDVQRLTPAILEAAFAETGDAPRVRLGDLACTTSGSTPSRNRKDYWQPPKYPWVKTGEVAFEPITSTGESISETALAECSLSLLPAGTVLIAMYGQGKTRGQSAVLRVPATTNQACFAILPGESHEPDYLQFWLRHCYKQLREQSEARGGNQSNLNGAILNDFEMPLIPLAQQRTIVTQLKAALVDAERLSDSIRNRLAEIQRLPARLLAKAFAPHADQPVGTTRLSDDY